MLGLKLNHVDKSGGPGGELMESYGTLLGSLLYANVTSALGNGKSLHDSLARAFAIYCNLDCQGPYHWANIKTFTYRFTYQPTNITTNPYVERGFPVVWIMSQIVDMMKRRSSIRQHNGMCELLR